MMLIGLTLLITSTALGLMWISSKVINMDPPNEFPEIVTTLEQAHRMISEKTPPGQRAHRNN